ncbi:MAG: hypothetical protein U9Q62_00585 [Campylobacterota bacterium]|nr:hypothetical protein [Campylobacterota bacterium]
MQAFGKFATEEEFEYLTEHYLYFNEPEETISIDDLKVLLKKKNKTVAGTIFLYNPVIAPKGYTTDIPLAEQGYEFDGEYTQLQMEKLMDIFQSRIKGYEGKLIEVKYLFNYNRSGTQSGPAIETFNEDLGKLASRQSTHFSRELNYHDVKNIRISGKFVFFAWGHNFDQLHRQQNRHPNIMNYATGIFEQVRKIGKPAAFIYNGVIGAEGSEKEIRFFHPIATGKLKTKITEAIAKAFSTNPPQPTAYEE